VESEKGRAKRGEGGEERRGESKGEKIVIPIPSE